MRTSPAFVNGFSIFYFLVAIATFIYLWTKVPVISEIPTHLLDFGFNFFYVVTGALLWPGTLLALFF